MMNEIITQSIPLAEYREAIIEDYRGNPFIEATELIIDEKILVEKLTKKIKITEKERVLPCHIRYYIIKRIRRFRVPFRKHIEIAEKIATIVFEGYRVRFGNDNKAYLKLLRTISEIERNSEKGEEVEKALEKLSSNLDATAETALIIGISGVGKTTAVKSVLGMFEDQVVRHEVYNGEPFTRTQIIYMYITFPSDGNLLTFCKNIFKEVDRLTGASTYAKYGYTNKMDSNIIYDVCRVLNMYHVGVLAVDEIQIILKSKNKKEEVLNFLITLSNTLGVPTILIGTPMAEELFETDLAVIRKNTSGGDIVWGNMGTDEVSMQEWDIFVKMLWKNQILINYTPLNEKLKKAFYEETQGIVAIAINLFMYVQERALKEEEEQITVELIHETARLDMPHVQPVIKALKSGNLKEIRKFSDIDVSCCRTASEDERRLADIEKARRILEMHLDNNSAKRDDKVNQIVYDIRLFGVFSDISYMTLERLVQRIVDEARIDEEIEDLKRTCIKELLHIQEEEKIKKQHQISLQKHSQKEDSWIYLLGESKRNGVAMHDTLRLTGGSISLVERFLLGNWI